MKRNLLLFLIVLLCQPCRGQQKSIVYNAEKEYFDDGTKSSGLGFLSLMIDNTVYNKGKKFTVNIPEEFKNKKIAWGETYFTGVKKSKRGFSIFFLISNYDTAGTRIIFDKNSNMDFTDDSIVNIEKGKWFKNILYNQKDTEGLFTSSFLLRTDITDTFYAKLHKVMAGNWPGVLPYRFMIFDRRMNYKKVILPDSNIITLCDYDCNGLYNDKEDKIIAGDIQKNPEYYINPVRTKNVKEGVKLPFFRNTYQLEKVNKYGNSVSLITLNKVTDTIEKMPDFKFTDAEGQKKDFMLTTGKPYSILYIWGSWCIGCVYQSPGFAKLMKAYADKAGFFTFNFGDKEEKIREYLTIKNLPFTANRIDRKNNDLLHIDGYPAFLIINKNKQIIKRTLSVEEVELFLKTE